MKFKNPTEPTDLSVQQLKRLHKHLEDSLKNDVWADGTPQRWSTPTPNHQPWVYPKRNFRYWIDRLWIQFKVRWLRVKPPRVFFEDDSKVEN